VEPSRDGDGVSVLLGWRRFGSRPGGDPDVTVGSGLTVRYNHGGVGVAASLSKCCKHVLEITFPVLRLASQLEEGSQRLDRMPV
jgi:hypothetical protein